MKNMNAMPKEMEMGEEEEGQETEEGGLDEAGNIDINTARGILGSLILAPEGESQVVKALSSSNPPKMLAMFLMQGIEMIQRRSMDTETPLDPRIWLAGGGVIDEIMVDIAEISADNSIPFKIGDTLPLLKQELAKIMQQRGEQLKQESDGQEPPLSMRQQPQPQQPPSRNAVPQR